MQINITIDEDHLRKLVFEYLKSTLGDVEVSVNDIMIEVKSKQNFRSEWEPAKFRAIYNKLTHA